MLEIRDAEKPSGPFLAGVLAASTEHGDFADYHERFKHTDAHTFC